jgi:hypothetical protein
MLFVKRHEAPRQVNSPFWKRFFIESSEVVVMALFLRRNISCKTSFCEITISSSQSEKIKTSKRFLRRRIFRHHREEKRENG